MAWAVHYGDEVAVQGGVVGGEAAPEVVQGDRSVGVGILPVRDAGVEASRRVDGGEVDVDGVLGLGVERGTVGLEGGGEPGGGGIESGEEGWGAGENGWHCGRTVCPGLLG